MRKDTENMIIVRFSCGVTPAVACKIVLSLYNDVHIYYIETDPTCQWYAKDIGLLFLDDCYSRIKVKELLDNYIEDLTKAIDKLKELFGNL